VADPQVTAVVDRAIDQAHAAPSGRLGSYRCADYSGRNPVLRSQLELMGSLCLSHYRPRFICEAARRPSEPRTPTTGEIMGRRSSR
jgi:hypothetical protein